MSQTFGLTDEQAITALRSILVDVEFQLSLIEKDDRSYDDWLASQEHRYNCVLPRLLAELERDGRYLGELSLAAILGEEHQIARAMRERAHADYQRRENKNQARTFFLTNLQDLVKNKLQDLGVAT